MIEQYTSPVAVNNSQEPWLVGEGVVVSGGVAIPSLDFDFITGGLPGTVTFTRGSNATQFDSSGNLVYAPANLLTWSEDFGNAAWTKQASVSVATNTTVAPDETTTGDTVTADSGLGVFQNVTVTVGTQVTQSVYLRAGTATAVMFRDDTGAGRHIVVNPSTGAITSTAGTLINSGSVSVGNSWYRIFFSYVADSTLVRAIIRPDSAGAGQTFIVWGAQTNLFPMLGGVTASLSTYYPTTASAYYGPRLDYNPTTLAARGLLIEEQRTNSIRNNTMQGAVAGTPGTPPTNWGVSGTADGVAIQIVGTGTENGITYIDIRYSGTATATSFKIVRFEAVNNIAAASGQTWTAATYMRIAAGSTANFTGFEHQVVGYTAGGAVSEQTNTPPVLTSTMTRFTTSRTLNNATTAFVTSWFALTFNNGAVVDLTLRIGLPQLEQGAFATSVIPTTTTALTRNADVASVNTLSPWYNATEGTLFAEYQPVVTAQTLGGVSFSDGTNNNRMIIRAMNTSSETRFIGSNGGVIQWNDGFLTATATATKSAFAYATNDIASTRNGATPVADTLATIPTVDRLVLGADADQTAKLNGYLRRITYYPRRLSNAELQAITA